MKVLKVIYAIFALSFVACAEPDYGSIPDTTIPTLGTPEDNEIWFTTTDSSALRSLDQTAFNTSIREISNSELGVSVIRFDGAVTEIGDNAFNGCHNLFNISLPNSVTTIGEKAFYECINMECLTIGSGLRKCDSEAFNWCGSLHSLHIPDIYNWCKIEFETPTSNPTYFSQMLIIEGDKIEKLNIPNSIEHISDYAFYNNTNLKSVSASRSISKIGAKAFYGCDNIARVEIRDISAWSCIDFEDEESNPLSFAEELYLGDKKVESVNLHSIESISSYAFINCTTIKTLTTDDTLKKVGVGAFRNCTSLTTATLGSGIEEMGNYAFAHCTALSLFTCYAVQPPTLEGNNVFDWNSEEFVIAVPTESFDKYLSDAMWSKYSNSIKSIE